MSTGLMAAQPAKRSLQVPKWSIPQVMGGVTKEWSMCKGVCRLLLENFGTRKLFQQAVQCQHYTRGEGRGGLSTSPEV